MANHADTSRRAFMTGAPRDVSLDDVERISI
jgi:hypothetical protein